MNKTIDFNHIISKCVFEFAKRYERLVMKGEKQLERFKIHIALVKNSIGAAKQQLLTAELHLERLKLFCCLSILSCKPL